MTEGELARVQLKSGMVTVHLGEVITRVPRSEVASAQLAGGVSPALTITFDGHDDWQLEVPRPSKRRGWVVESPGSSPTPKIAAARM